MVSKVLFSSESGEHETPTNLYQRLDRTFDFTLDPCATDKNHKCPKWYTKKSNGLAQSWQGERVFMNPPYGRDIVEWIRKADQEWRQGRCLIVGLLPARIDTAWWWKYIQGMQMWVPIKGRLTFEKNGKPLKIFSKKQDKWIVCSAPFPSVLVYWTRMPEESETQEYYGDVYNKAIGAQADGQENG